MAGKRDHQELIDKLSNGISKLASSDEWNRYLELQSRFHRYSFSNVLLIAAQRPLATQVAGFNAWRKMDRCVRNGEKAIWILAPMVYEASDAGAGELEKVIRGFKYVPVFDIAQTEGEDLPDICQRITGDDPDGHYARLKELVASIGFTVDDHAFDDSTNGDCCHEDHRIRIEVRNSPAQRVKTLVHEIAHALLHERFDGRALAELEAESTAYVVCQIIGIESADYSFGYVTTWAGGGDEAIAQIKESCQRIQKCAASILRAFETGHEEGAARPMLRRCA
jgi:antirestriction protein ArdC